MKNLVLLILAATVLGFGALSAKTPSARAQDAAPLPDVYMVTGSTCIALGGLSAISACQSMLPAGTIVAQRTVFTGTVFDTDANGTVTREELSGFDAFTGHQVHQTDGVLIAVKVDYPRAVDFSTNIGQFKVDTGGTIMTQNFNCDLPSTSGVDTLENDDDCSSQPTGFTAADGLVYAQLVTNGATAGSAGNVTVTDKYTGEIIGEIPFTVVGSARTMGTIQTFETSVQGESSEADCTFPGDTAGFLTALGDPAKSIFLVHVKDIFGNDITGAWVKVTVDDPTAAVIALPDSPTLDLGSFGYAAPNVICGLKGPTTVKVTATVELGPQGTVFDVGATDPGSAGSFDIDVRDVVGSVSLVADPASLVCDGTTSSKVTATVLDTQGDPVAAGVPVHFDVQTLATADPINPITDDKGVTSSVITPLAVGQTGVSLNVFSEGIGTSLLLSCVSPEPTAPPPPPEGGGTTPPEGTTGGAGGVITGPNTGSGGLDGAGTLSWWPLLGLLAAAAALGAVRLGFATARRDE